MTPVAFALKAGYDSDCVGAVFVNNQRDFNIREALQEGNGQILTDDPLIIERLDGLDTLKRVSAADVAQQQQDAALEQAKANLADHTVSQLRDLAERAGIDAPAGAKKDELVDLVAESQATNEITGA